MPLGAVSEKNIWLDAMFGSTHGSGAPSSHALALFTDNPYDGGVEVTGGGYARVTLTNNAGWPAAADGMKTRTATFPAPSGAWTDATCWVLYNSSAITAWERISVLEVSGAGGGPVVTVTLYIPDDANVAA